MCRRPLACRGLVPPALKSFRPRLLQIAAIRDHRRAASARARAGSALEGTPAGALLDRVEVSALAAMGKRDGLIERIDRALPAARAAGTYFDLVVLLVLRSSLNEGVRPELIEERDKLLDQLGIVAVRVLVQVP